MDKALLITINKVIKITKMKFVRHIFVTLAMLTWMSSCRQEDIQGGPERSSDDVITFCTSNSDGITTRTDEEVSGDASTDIGLLTYDKFNEFYVTSFLGGRQSGVPYFQNTRFACSESERNNPLKVFTSATPYLWPVTPIEFYAYYPDRGYDGIKYIPDNSDDGYKLTGFEINTDMRQKIDFVAADPIARTYSQVASDVNNHKNTINLAFNHKLCNIEFKAYSDNTQYDYEIVGIRLGNPGMRGNFNFNGKTDETYKATGCSYTIKNGQWENIQPERFEYIFKSGEKVAKLLKKTESQQHAASISIMGDAKSAMVIPIKNNQWSKTYERAETTKPTTTTEMYVSVLIRVSRNNGKDVAYPYPHRTEYPYPKKTETTAIKGQEQEERYNMFNERLIYFALDTRAGHEGEILDRLYLREDLPFLFYTDPDGETPYGWYDYGDIELFGWAAIPVEADWEAGQQYTYTLDFSDGLGLHDPDYPDPGQPIYNVTHPTVTWGKRVNWGVNVNPWKPGTYDPDVEIDFE